MKRERCGICPNCGKVLHWYHIVHHCKVQDVLNYSSKHSAKMEE